MRVIVSDTLITQLTPEREAHKAQSIQQARGMDTFRRCSNCLNCDFFVMVSNCEFSIAFLMLLSSFSSCPDCACFDAGDIIHSPNIASIGSFQARSSVSMSPMQSMTFARQAIPTFSCQVGRAINSVRTLLHCSLHLYSAM